MAKTYRAATIGATGRGDYGHGIDVVFKNMPGVDFVAIADADPEGLANAGKRNGVTRLYSDYREMLEKERPDVVSIGPRWTDQHVAMVKAAASAGSHIFCEKPLASNLVDMDEILDACRQGNVKIAVAHQMRSLPPIRQVAREIQEGKHGRLLRMRARGKEDHRGGGEDLIVLGTHLMDLMTLFAGKPLWVSGHVAVGERDAALEDGHPASEPVGRVAGDSVSGSYGFEKGVRGGFDSRRDVSRAGRVPFFLTIECDEATLAIREGEVHVYPSSVLLPDDSKLAWKKVWVEDWHFHPDHTPRNMSDRFARGNRIIVEDLLAAGEEDREPMVSGESARLALEMIQGIYQSHFAGGARQAIPLANRQHPLGA